MFPISLLIVVPQIRVFRGSTPISFEEKRRSMEFPFLRPSFFMGFLLLSR